jgi:hypothetical protein
MLTSLITLLVLCGVLTGLGQDRLKPTSYTRGLEPQPVRGRTIGITDGDTIKVLAAAQTTIQGPFGKLCKRIPVEESVSPGLN